jgi:ribosomal protein S18 acetylase RimI-like enzyme
MKVREVTEQDVDVLVAFQKAMAVETEDKGLIEASLKRGIEYLLAHPQEGYYLIAECDGEPAGSLMVTFEWSDWRNGRFWWIQSVYVADRFRRRGVYSALHDALRSRAVEDPQGCGIRLYVEQENGVAQTTYRTLGMTETHYRLFEEEF